VSLRVFFVAIACTALFAAKPTRAQQPSPVPAPVGDVESLKQQMLEMQAGLKQMQIQHQREVAALRAQVESLHKVIGDLQRTVATGAGQPVPPVAGKTAVAAQKPAAAGDGSFPTTDESVAAPTGQPGASGSGIAAASSGFPTSDATVAAAPGATTPGWLKGGPITLAGGGKTFLNLSFDGQFSGATSSERHLDRLEVGDHDPQQRGFNARNTELALDGAVDPYFEGFANIVFKLDNDNETSVEVEEAFMQTTTLPWSLQAKGGQFFAPFGRINPQHPHVWDFVDAPVVVGRLLGPDGLRGVGAQLAWLMPLPWYSQLSLAVQNGNGGTGFSFRNQGDNGVFYGRTTFDRALGGVDDLVFVPRLESSFDLSSTQTLLVGTSGAFGPNDTGKSARTEIYGADLFYKWKSAHAEGGWPFVKWQSEVLGRRFEADRGVDDEFPVAETFDDWGAYSQVVWGFYKGWAAGLRGDFLHMENSSFTDDPERQSRWRISPDVTWYPTEFSKFRLQYNHDFLEANHFTSSANADSVFLQFEFSLGAHGAHKF
jgi:hypothetical protein